MNTNNDFRKTRFLHIIKNLSKYSIIVSLEDIKKYLNDEKKENISISGISHSLKTLEINLKELNQLNYEKYISTKFISDLNKIDNLENKTLDKISKYLEFPKSNYILKAELDKLGKLTKESKKNFFDKLFNMDCSMYSLKELYNVYLKIAKKDKVNFLSFQSKIYASDLKFKNRKFRKNKAD